jgi:hypothetical protein
VRVVCWLVDNCLLLNPWGCLRGVTLTPRHVVDYANMSPRARGKWFARTALNNISPTSLFVAALVLATSYLDYPCALRRALLMLDGYQRDPTQVTLYVQSLGTTPYLWRQRLRHRLSSLAPRPLDRSRRPSGGSLHDPRLVSAPLPEVSPEPPAPSSSWPELTMGSFGDDTDPGLHRGAQAALPLRGLRPLLIASLLTSAVAQPGSDPTSRYDASPVSLLFLAAAVVVLASLLWQGGVGALLRPPRPWLPRASKPELTPSVRQGESACPPVLADTGLSLPSVPVPVTSAIDARGKSAYVEVLPSPLYKTTKLLITF